MDMAIIFMVVASLAPIIFFWIKKYWLGGLQILLLIGMWAYFIVGLNPDNIPVPFSVLWFSFYGGLIVSAIAYVMLAIRLVEEIQQEYGSDSDDGYQTH